MTYLLSLLKAAIDTAVKAIVTTLVAVLLAAVGVGAAKGDIKEGLEVPGEILRGAQALEAAATKYLNEP